MRKVVWKYALIPGYLTDITMPAGAQVLCAREQGNDICVWALVDADQAATEVVKFAVRPTGQEFDDAGKYVGTAHLPGPLVFHVFVLPKCDIDLRNIRTLEYWPGKPNFTGFAPDGPEHWPTSR